MLTFEKKWQRHRRHFSEFSSRGIMNALYDYTGTAGWW